MSKVNDEIDKFIKDALIPVGALSKKAIIDVIDEEARLLFENIKAYTPVKTKGLVSSLRIVKKTDSINRYGYLVEYDGYNDSNIPYALIANALNKGTKTISATRYIDRAIRKLKGIDKRIFERFQELLKRG